jgi:myxalamid-type polyketide synthase MxaE and MxaD
LDFFVLFSSVSTLLGMPGQGNYSAANAFLDALAHYRKMRGLSALSINWGAWGEVGMVAQPEMSRLLAQQGIQSFTPERGLEALARLMWQDPAQAGVMLVNWQQWFESHPVARQSSLLADLSRRFSVALPKQSAAVKERKLNREALLAAEFSERQGLVERFLSEQVAGVLGHSPSGLDVNRPLDKLGLDSLMAVQLKNRIESELGVVVPVVKFLQGPTVSQLTTFALDELAKSGSTQSSSPSPSAAAGKREINGKSASQKSSQKLLAELDQLSDEEVDSLLSNALSENEGKQ